MPTSLSEPRRPPLLPSEATGAASSRRPGTPPPTPARSRDPLPFFLKGLGCIAVVAHHLANKAFPEPERTWVLVWSIALPGSALFLVVAGYLHGLAERRNALDGLRYVTSRALKMLPHFVVLTFVYAVLYTVLVRVGLYPAASASAPVWYEKWMTGLLCQPGRVGEQLYFLPLMVLISALATGVMQLTRLHRGWILATAVLVALSATANPVFFDTWLPGHPPNWPWSRTLRGLGIYLGGYWLAGASARGALRLFLAAATLTALALWQESKLPYYSFMALTLLAGLIILRPRLRPLELIGEASTTVYLYHTPFFIQPLLYLAAISLPRSLHVAAAGAVLVAAVVSLTALHYKIRKSRFRWLTI